MSRRRELPLFLAVAAAALLTACGSPTSPDGVDLSDSQPLEGGSTLVFQNATSIADQRAKIEQIVHETLAQVRSLMPLDGFTLIAGVGTANVIPEIGIGGRADAGTVWMAFDPSSAAWPASLDTELAPLLAHEMHHVVRSRTAGYGDTLLEAMISEGLADQFAIELTGISPPLWSVALTPQELATWSANARPEWHSTSYNHAGWFFGTAPPIPRWAGYSIGFELTRQFLDANPGRLPSGLFAEPATSFIPPDS